MEVGRETADGGVQQGSVEPTSSGGSPQKRGETPRQQIRRAKKTARRRFRSVRSRRMSPTPPLRLAGVTVGLGYAGRRTKEGRVGLVTGLLALAMLCMFVVHCLPGRDRRTGQRQTQFVAVLCLKLCNEDVPGTVRYSVCEALCSLVDEPFAEDDSELCLCL